MQTDGMQINQNASQNQTPLLNFDQLLEVSNVNKLLDMTSKNQKLDEKFVQTLNKQLKDKMKLLLKTILDKYTHYLTHAFQMSIQSQMKQVSDQQLYLMQLFQSSIQQTLSLMHRPNHFNPSIVQNSSKNKRKQHSERRNSKLQNKNKLIVLDKYDNSHNSINTRKHNELRFRLNSASNDITVLKNQNLKLIQKIDDLTNQLNEAKLKAKQSKEIMNKLQQQNMLLQSDSQNTYASENDHDNDDDASSPSASDSEDLESSYGSSVEAGTHKTTQHKTDKASKSKQQSTPVTIDTIVKLKTHKNFGKVEQLSEIWSYIKFCERNSTHELDINRLKFLLKKVEVAIAKKNKIDSDKIKDMNLRINKLASDKLKLEQQLKESKEKFKHIDELKTRLEKHFDDKEQRIACDITQKIESFTSSISGLETSLESITIGMTCPKCLGQLQDPVFLSDCKHTVCMKCVTIIGDNALKCPECKKVQTNDCKIQIPILQDIVGRVSSFQYHCEKMKRKSQDIVEIKFD